MDPARVAEYLNEPSESLYRLISFTARDLRRAIAGEMREWGITGQQFGVLLGAAEDSNIAAIAEQLLTDPTSAGRIVERMEAAGLVERYQQPPDRRVVWVRLQPAGRDLLARCLPMHVERTGGLLGVLDQSERALLGSLLEKVRDHLAAGVSTTAE